MVKENLYLLLYRSMSLIIQQLLLMIYRRLFRIAYRGPKELFVCLTRFRPKIKVLAVLKDIM